MAIPFSDGKIYKKSCPFLIKFLFLRNSTPLFPAAENGHKPVIDYLIKQKAMVDVENYE